MHKKKDKKLRRQIEVLKAQLSALDRAEEKTTTQQKKPETKTTEEQNAETRKVSMEPKIKIYASAEIVKKDLRKSILLSLVALIIIIVSYYSFGR